MEESWFVILYSVALRGRDGMVHNREGLLLSSFSPVRRCSVAGLKWHDLGVRRHRAVAVSVARQGACLHKPLWLALRGCKQTSKSAASLPPAEHSPHLGRQTGKQTSRQTRQRLQTPTLCRPARSSLLGFVRPLQPAQHNRLVLKKHASQQASLTAFAASAPPMQ